MPAIGAGDWERLCPAGWSFEIEKYEKMLYTM
jgi:hypothetical protein